jgi:metallo-beta-lactamase class B
MLNQLPIVKKICCVLPCFILAAFAQVAQAQERGAKGAAEVVTLVLEKAKKTAGTQWAAAEHFFCETPHANAATDPNIEPTRIFDNVYAIGNQGTVAYVIKTSAGLMMIDTLNANQVDTLLMPGFQKLGLDPATVKTVIISHGHADHFGASFYLQEHFNPHVYVSAADWDMMLKPPAEGPARVTPPRKDMIITEGQPIVLGDEQVIPVAIPGHTPGSMGFIFPVKDEGKTHMAAMFGGTILLPGRVPIEGLQAYQGSIARFKQETDKMKVDVELQNHPLMDDLAQKLEKLAARKKGDPNPFIAGEANYGKFLDVMSQCIDYQIALKIQTDK